MAVTMVSASRWISCHRDTDQKMRSGAFLSNRQGASMFRQERLEGKVGQGDGEDATLQVVAQPLLFCQVLPIFRGVRYP